MIKQYVQRNRFILLLVATITYLVLPAFFSNYFFYELLMLITMSFLLVQSIYAVFLKNRHRIPAFVIGFLFIIFLWAEHYGNSQVMLTLRFSAYAGFFSFILFALFRIIISSKKVTLDMISLAIVVYLMMGIIGGALAILIHMYVPGAYTIAEGSAKLELLKFTYFSFVTLSTLGYGDITPNLPESQTLSYMLAIAGQFYIAIIVALLVSKYATDDSSTIEEHIEEDAQ